MRSNSGKNGSLSLFVAERKTLGSKRNRVTDHGEILLVRHGIDQNAKETRVSTHCDIVEDASANQSYWMISLPPALCAVKRVLFSELREELVRSLLVTEKSNRERVHILRDRTMTDKH